MIPLCTMFAQNNRSRAHGRRPPSSWLPVVTQGRGFSGTTPASGKGAAAGSTDVDDAKLSGNFPWRGAPELVVEPAGQGSFLDGIMESVFETFCLQGVNFGVRTPTEVSIHLAVTQFLPRLGGGGRGSCFNHLDGDSEQFFGFCVRTQAQIKLRWIILQ